MPDNTPPAIAIRRVNRSGIVDEAAGTELGVDITLADGEERRLLVPLEVGRDAAIAFLIAHHGALKLREAKGFQDPLELQRIEISGAEGMAFGAAVQFSLLVKNGGALSFALTPKFAREIAANLIACAEAAEQYASQRH